MATYFLCSFSVKKSHGKWTFHLFLVKIWFQIIAEFEKKFKNIQRFLKNSEI